MSHQSISGVSYLPGQLELAGCEPSTRDMLQRRSEAPLRAGKRQSACDIGLFSDAADQLDLVEMFMDLEEDCPACGGSGVIDDECECMDDTCCCLVPQPPLCPECGYGRGSGSR
jgi:hypothetical protein